MVKVITAAAAKKAAAKAATLITTMTRQFPAADSVTRCANENIVTDVRSVGGFFVENYCFGNWDLI